MLAALHEREQQREHGDADDAHAHQVQADLLGERASTMKRRPAATVATAIGHVHQEDRAPAQAGDVGVDQEAAQDRPGDRREGHDRAPQAERGGHLLGREERP